MILHPSSDGWLEQHTMDVLRGERSSGFAPLIVIIDWHCTIPLCPMRGRCISVHSKVCVIDDVYVRIGSANLSNRSLGFDTECDLAVQASGDPNVGKSIAAFRNRLLGEHLDISSEDVAQALRSHSS